MSGIAFNSDDLLEDDAEVLPLGGPAAERAGDVFPAHPSWANSEPCPSSFQICISHLLYDSNLLHKKAGAGARQTGSRSSHTEILTGRTPADDIHRRQTCPVQLCDISHMDHVGKMVLRDLDGKGFDLAGPHGRDPVPDRSQGEAADAIEEAPHSECHPIAIPIPSVGEKDTERISCVLILQTGMPSSSASFRSPSMPGLTRSPHSHSASHSSSI